MVYQLGQSPLIAESQSRLVQASVGWFYKE